MRKVSFDVMLHGRFVRSITIPLGFMPLTQKALCHEVEIRCPWLAGNDYRIMFNK